MCGIAGFVCTNNELSKQDLIRFNDIQSHRGPDFQNIFFDGFAGLSHQRLKILDMSNNGNQPMESHCKRYIMVYNGEVYNYKYILKEIQKIDINFEPVSKSDTEIILQAFVIWGHDFINKLNGMFAIAIYDKQSKDLHLFRDRMGVKPLYYFYKSNVLAFSSELKTLAKTPTIRKQLTKNNKAINQYMHYGYIPSPNSIYNEIKKLKPGYCATFSENGTKFNTYRWWNIEKIIKKETIKDEKVALAKLKNLVEDSVKLRLGTDVPFGTFLSGGIDSSLITSIAQKYSDIPINTFSVSFPDKKFNEAKYAKNIASYLKTKHYEFELTHKEAADLMHTLIDIYDEPFADSSSIPTLFISKLASNTVKTVFSGDGGDELFMGYGAYNWAKRLSYPGVSILKTPASNILKLGNNRMKRVANLFDYKDKKSLESHIFSQEQNLFSIKEIASVLNHDLIENFNNTFSFNNISRSLSSSEKQALFDLKYYLPDDLLVKVDRASMRFGLEAREPLLDYKLVEFALNLNEKLKTKNSVQKYLLRELTEEYLPKKLIDHPKQGFSMPLNKWMKREFKPLTDEMLSKECIDKHKIFNFNYVNKIKKSFYEDNNNYLYNRLWQIMIMQMWHEKT